MTNRPADQVPDPVRYDVTLTTDADDPDLREALENSSRLVGDKDRPVSGDLGVVVKARDDRDRLIAALFEKARYGGVVTIRVDGRDIDDPSTQSDLQSLAPDPGDGQRRSRPRLQGPRSAIRRRRRTTAIRQTTIWRQARRPVR